jgi:hypothetical protein
MSYRALPYSKEQLAYAAGFFDGEGTVSFNISGSGGGVISASIENTNKEVIEYLKHEFGGTIFFTCHDNIKWKNTYSWSVSGQTCIDFLQNIKPWVIIKKEQINLAEFFFINRNTVTRKHGLSEEYKNEMKLIKRQFKWLNRKGKRLSSDIEPIPYKTGSIWYEDYHEEPYHQRNNNLMEI